jgi:hypothetical protein
MEPLQPRPELLSRQIGRGARSFQRVAALMLVVSRFDRFAALICLKPCPHLVMTQPLVD